MPKRQANEDPVSLKVARQILKLRKPGEPRKKFAARIGISLSTLNNYESGQNGASVRVLAQVVSRTGADANWLLTGEVPDLHSTSQVLPAAHRAALRLVLKQVRDALDEFERKRRLVPIEPEGDQFSRRESSGR